MTRYPPDRVSLFIHGFTRPEPTIAGPGSATILYRPVGRILPFWKVILAIAILAMLAALAFGDVEALEAAQMTVALLGMAAIIAIDRLLPWRGQAQIAAGMVTLDRRTAAGSTAEHWREPIGNYAGLRPWLESWTEVTDPGQWADGTNRMAVGQRQRSRRARLWLFLEHATDPGRSLPVMRHDDGGDGGIATRDLATRLGVPLLDMGLLDRRDGAPVQPVTAR
ncbi:hypothetical protein ACQW02_07535 [Humitalea sp. 24SJ18S-53]|uniref:hypothetical protein n=1 Tax=Humitalea sp. 24SJ18S-53 TaxID=3422307 RepID=UPI003D67F697